MCKKRALPIYWKILSHKGASNLTEKQAVIRPMLILLKKYQRILVGDREFCAPQSSANIIFIDHIG
ncbi:hypothetical protein [Okeania sp. SIO2B3]|uniref:hypothetical protein n=1 Tax=Okeania sp. SIO2B3 TaxID=2607784 RepID=UPI0013C25517|nr:hypothetical protein [Okeania sp. SIO2B3]NET45501.1 hypothetical protein [Okeania sp. SIO2B3]